MTEKQEVMVAKALEQIKKALESNDKHLSYALSICENALKKLSETPVSEINTAKRQGVFELSVVE